MIAAIQRPRFLPGPDFFRLMLEADLFLLLDEEPRGNGTHGDRALISGRGGLSWLTVPPTPEGAKNWGRKASRALRDAYRDASFYELYAPALEDILEEGWERLIELDLRLIETLRRMLGIYTPMVRASALGDGVGGLVALCRKAGASRVVAAEDTVSEFGRGALERAGISVSRRRYAPPRYAQYPRPRGQVPGLSVVDLLFHCGPDGGSVLKEEVFSHVVSNEAEAAD
jgi:hypothetical protein